MFYHYEQRRRGGAHGSQHHLNPLQSHNKTLKDRLGSKKDDGEKVLRMHRRIEGKDR